MAEKKGIPGQMLVFTTAQRLVHWLVVVGFTLLVFTSLPIYLDSPIAQGESGMLFKLWHRIGVVVTAVGGLIYLLFDPRSLLVDLKKIFTWGAADLGWFKAAPAYYFMGSEEAMPEQDKYNTGQKLWYLIVVVGGLLIGLTGLVMWFGRGTVSSGLFLWCVFLHSAVAVLMAAFTLVHVYLAVMHPLMKDGLDSIRFGYMPEEYLKHHHGKYYKELKAKSE
jgi:formate dehydrogenase subunit gamma